MKPRLTKNDMKLLKAIDIGGPLITNKDLASCTGRDIRRIRYSLKRLIEGWWLISTRVGNNRRLALSERPEGLDDVVVLAVVDPTVTQKRRSEIRTPHTPEITHRALTSRDQPKIRRCMTCRHDFESKWCGHRMCKGCNEIAGKNRSAFG